MTTKELMKSKSTSRDTNNVELEHGDANEINIHSTDDLHSFLSAHGSQLNSAAVHVLASRKRKFLDQGGNGQYGYGGGFGKFFGGLKASLRRNSDDDHTLHTPHCSQSGFADDEDRPNGNGEDVDDNDSDEAKQRLSLLSPGQSTIIADIDENLAADFDGSLSGLGVDINTSTYSMSEALLALPNLTTSSSQLFKKDATTSQFSSNLTSFSHHSLFTSRPLHPNLKEEPQPKSPILNQKNSKSNSSRSPSQNYGALDLSSDEAAHFPESDASEDAILGPKTFAGSVSRVTTPTYGSFHALTSSASHQQLSQLANSLPNSFNMSASHPNLTIISSSKEDDMHHSSNSMLMGNGLMVSGGQPTKSHKVILPLNNCQSGYLPRKESQELSQSSTSSSLFQESFNSSGFQFSLNASTSIATKVNEPSITYLNQGQGYELTLKKFGHDVSGNRKRLLKCQMRVGFHERRLQYMETEHISEWSLKHPSERILDIDLPLSYGVIDPIRDAGRLNVVSFKWDPSRDTGVFVKVNCISTEFTPKKHGGEKGVPFRLQVEAFDMDDNRLYAAGCILQVFKLKGADRKHKQDRDKIQKRPPSEQEKYARPYGCTILAELPQDSIYIPQNSRSTSPGSSETESNGLDITSSLSRSRLPTGEDSREMFYVGSMPSETKESMSNGNTVPTLRMNQPTMNSTQPVQALSPSATVDMVTQWLNRNRFGLLASSFRNYNGRDLLRLSRDDIISMCGLTDGLRLYNDLHTVVVTPRSTFFVSLKDTGEFEALYLDELTLTEFTRKLANSLRMEESSIRTIYKKTTRGFIVRVTDSVIQHTESESVFTLTVRHVEHGKCDIILEDAVPSQFGAIAKLFNGSDHLN